ncbi:MAG: CDP-diacylglycerol--serine O-phosphatidyltransferase [Rikenellaceae bacterium]|jgi:CDP-diacylglycerol--serine O-phosphatidyltransferase|nr:CDP-diacylglycerol--serine O-phosphatidyltransferase [Rikenellaceae bacterium]
MKVRYFTIPNLLTLSNLLCGSLAVVSALEGDLVRVFWLVMLSALCDFLDGFAARLLNQYSALGVQLDSLADMVSFGLVPSMVSFSILRTLEFGGECGAWCYVAFIVVLFSALRLARFNIDESQHEEFLGLPTPACSIFFVATGWMFDKGLLPNIDAVWYAVSAVVMATLLIVPVRMFSFKFKSFGWRGNELRFMFVILAVVAFAIWQVKVVPTVIVAYILISLVRHLLAKRVKE